MPLISIIIPCYNAEKFIDACLFGVTNQTYTNVEILCIDDKSTDKTLDKLKEWQKKDKRIKIFQNLKNRGCSNSRNLGLSLCKGEYITFVDSDDIIALNFLEDTLFIAEEYNLSIVKANHKTIDEDNNNNIFFGKKEHFTIRDINERQDIIFLQPLNVWGRLYRRDAITDYFLPNLIWEDFAFTTEIAIKNQKFGDLLNPFGLNSAYYYYRLNSSSTTERLQIPSKRNLDIIFVLKLMLNNLKEYYTNGTYKTEIDVFITKSILNNISFISTSIALNEEEQIEMEQRLFNISRSYFPTIDTTDCPFKKLNPCLFKTTKNDEHPVIQIEKYLKRAREITTKLYSDFSQKM